MDALIGTGSSESFLSQSYVQRHKLTINPGNGRVSMASTSLCSNITGYCIVDMILKEHDYIKAKLAVLTDLCADIVIGHDILSQHYQIFMDFGVNKTPLTLCSLTQA